MEYNETHREPATPSRPRAESSRAGRSSRAGSSSSATATVRSRTATPKTTNKRGRSATEDRKDLDDADEEEEEPSPSQVEPDELYVTFRSDCVGIQHYPGLVATGEVVMLKREPNNPYDANAIQINKATGVRVGHIPRGVAARLAPYIDANLITLEGKMLQGNTADGARRYKLKLDVSIFARASHRRHLEPVLSWATPNGLGFDRMRQEEQRSQTSDTGVHGAGPSRSQTSSSNQGDKAGDKEIMKILAGLGNMKQDGSASDSIMDSLTAEMDAANLPMHPNPPSLASGDLMVDLLPHQLQALQWMVGHENPKLPKKVGDPAVQFWARHATGGKTTGSYWLNVATRTPQSEAPVLGRGGILADGMGLGKTLTVIALALATRKDKSEPGYCRSTLIVCPPSVLGNWDKQLQDHVVLGKLKWYTYHGAGRDTSAADLEKHDIVLTTYQAVAADASEDIIPSKRNVKKGKHKDKAGGPLAQVKWKRIVADEGHIMKNPKAKLTQAFASLNAERRWVCTGTPIVNAVLDMGTLLSCIQTCAPLDNPEYFKSLVIRPLRVASQSAEAGRLLQAIVSQALLRRTKESKDKNGKNIVSLPPIEYYQVPVTLDDATKKIYDEIHAESARRIQQMQETDNGINVLSMITRMRQLCLSADLVPPSFLEDLRRGTSTSSKSEITFKPNLTPEETAELIEKLRAAVADQEECPVCFDILSDPRITRCGHSFCFLCISEVIKRHQPCPLDRYPLTLESLLEVPDAEGFTDHTTAPPVRSAKINELVRYLKALDSEEKSLVFSQFTSFLDRVAAVLQEEGIEYCRFDGSMSAKQRQAVIRKFQTPVQDGKSSPVVMLISLKSGAVGLNLTAANNVFLCDPWWQSAIEAQAIDRVHRMGQKKTVRVFQLLATDTIEQKMIEIQKRKDAIVAKAFEKSGTHQSRAQKKQARFEEMRELFGIK